MPIHIMVMRIMLLSEWMNLWITLDLRIFVGDFIDVGIEKPSDGNLSTMILLDHERKIL